jgi:hypothetical protein
MKTRELSSSHSQRGLLATMSDPKLIVLKHHAVPVDRLDIRFVYVRSKRGCNW